MISVSIVSHGHWHHVQTLLADMAGLAAAVDVEVILTFNVDESTSFRVSDFPWPIVVLENSTPKGFGANHNAAFLKARGEWFCVLNPDLRLPGNPFPRLLGELTRHSASVIAPAVVTSAGGVEDSVRHFPTARVLLAKLLDRSDGRYPYRVGDETFAADWVAGMFMLFQAEEFKRVGGFDEDYFLYYEDVDICARLWKSGGRVLACPKAQVIHDARRTSRHDLRYMRRHLTSMARYFWKHWGRLPRGSTS